MQEVMQITGENVEGLKEVTDSCVAQLKYDGSKYFLHIKNGKAFALTSKRISVKTGKLNEKLDNFPKLQKQKFPFKKLTIVVVEAIAEHLPEIPQEEVCGYVSGICNSLPEKAKDNKLVFLAHSFLYYEGKDIRNESYKVKYDLVRKHFPDAGIFGKNITAEKIIWAVKNIPLEKVGYSYDEIKNTIEKSKKFIWEGIVVKDMNSVKMMKVVKVLTADCIIIGYDESSTGKYAEKGWIRSLIVGVFISEEGVKLYRKNKKLNIEYFIENGFIQEIARVSGMDENMRQLFSEYDYIGSVVTVKYKGWNGKKLRHPRFDRLREDQAVERCTILQLEEKWR